MKKNKTVPANPGEIKEAYESPIIEIEEVKVEQGFQVSGGSEDMTAPGDSSTW